MFVSRWISQEMAVLNFPKVMLCIGALAAAMLAGCGGGDGRVVHSVSGEVLLDGSPLPAGDILFEPVDQAISPEAGKVTNGQFSMQAPAGKCTVRITAMRASTKTEVGAMGEAVAKKEQYLPAQYNSASTLTADIPSGGTSDLKFEVSAK